MTVFNLMKAGQIIRTAEVKTFLDARIYFDLHMRHRTQTQPGFQVHRYWNGVWVTTLGTFHVEKVVGGRRTTDVKDTPPTGWWAV